MGSQFVIPTVIRIEKHSEFLQLLHDLRTLRRFVVDKITNNNKFDIDSAILSLKNALKSIENCMENGENDQQDDAYQAEFTLNEPSSKLNFNIKDELLSVKKDVSFLELYQSSSKHSTAMHCVDVDNLRDRLKIYHPVSEDHFRSEVDDLNLKISRYLRSFTTPHQNRCDHKFDYFLTDWDGTYKTYGCNYATCMQPAYSAIILNLVRRHLCKFVAVLTAGPLEGPGILDLTALNPWDKINVGGSWGREWLLEDEKSAENSPNRTTNSSNTRKIKLLDKSCFNSSNEQLFETLKRKISDLLKKPAFSNFEHVGSGFQQKVDRITMAYQNVVDEVPLELTKSYLNELDAIMKTLDPKGEIFEWQRSRHDVEIIVKDEVANKAWSKRDGLRLLTSHLPNPLNDQSKVIVCGDTASDLPMLHFLRDECGVRPLVVFVRPLSDLQDKLRQEMTGEATDRLAIVGCPEVLHVALLKAIRERS
uniref:Trehalose-6-phosphate phosphatase helical bundle domain-containing protein n=1 Tax=Romanomermis culicivorax TaxID=13658 RepID=A0A915K617_ROMCU